VNDLSLQGKNGRDQELVPAVLCYLSLASASSIPLIRIRCSTAVIASRHWRASQGQRGRSRLRAMARRAAVPANRIVERFPQSAVAEAARRGGPACAARAVKAERWRWRRASGAAGAALI